MHAKRLLLMPAPVPAPGGPWLAGWTAASLSGSLEKNVVSSTPNACFSSVGSFCCARHFGPYKTSLISMRTNSKQLFCPPNSAQGEHVLKYTSSVQTPSGARRHPRGGAPSGHTNFAPRGFRMRAKPLIYKSRATALAAPILYRYIIYLYLHMK